jgi:hypothetical protein
MMSARRSPSLRFQRETPSLGVWLTLHNEWSQRMVIDPNVNQMNKEAILHGNKHLHLLEHESTKAGRLADSSCVRPLQTNKSASYCEPPDKCTALPSKMKVRSEKSQTWKQCCANCDTYNNERCQMTRVSKVT